MSVLLVGDILLERFLVSGEGYDSYAHHAALKAAGNQIRSVCRGGGALLTLEALRQLDVETVKSEALEIKPDWWWDLSCDDGGNCHRIARQILDLMRAPVLPGSSDKTYRVRRTLSFDHLNAPEDLHFDTQLKSQKQTQVVVVEDFDLGGSTNRANTAHLAREKAKGQVLIKTTRPREWIEDIAKQPVDNVIVVGNINNFFLSHGYARGSWDAVLRDLIQNLQQLKQSSGWTLILLCENEGVVMARPDRGDIRLWLAWDRKAPLGGLASQDSSWTPGCQNMLTAHLANALVRETDAPMWDLTLKAWESARRAGFFGVDLKNNQNRMPNLLKVFGRSEEEELSKVNGRVGDYKKLAYEKLPSDPRTWSMLHHQVKEGNWPKGEGTDRAPLCLRYLAYALIERGPDALTSEWPKDDPLPEEAAAKEQAAKLAEGIPVYTVGQLVSVDAAETNELTRLTELIRDYARRERPLRPLSIAVFGKPGSGKSFAVRQILGHLGIASETLTFNLSQFRSSDDLGPAMQSVQTAGLQNRLPVVFWDEFDAELNSVPKGWLRYFLAPMQDGEFLSNGKVHVLGRAIFVFAGGISHTSEEFYNPANESADANPAAKVPDFATRVKAKYNVPGIELPDLNSADLFDREQLWATVLRRALIIRRCILEHAPRVQEVSNIVLSRLLFGREYRTARDLENTIEAAPLAFTDRFDESLLPPPIWNLKGAGPHPFIPEEPKYVPINRRH